jgi:hypothetical protein
MPGRTKLKQGQTQTSKEEGGSTSRTTAQIEKYYSGGKRPFTYKKNDRGKVIKVELKGGGMSSGQAKIAAKAPPPNKIDAKDFAVLRQEKAKGRGMGLQDEKVQPGKVMKARVGRSVTRIPLAGKATSVGSTTMKGMKFSDKAKMVDSGKINKATGKFTSMEALRESVGYRPGESTDKFNKRRMALAAAKKAASASRIGKIALGIGTAGVAASQYIKSKMNKKNNKTLRDARLQKKPGIPSETTQKINKALSNIKTVKLKKDKKMSGGMMKPMGYTTGGSHFDKKNHNVVKHIRVQKKMGGGMMKPMGYSEGTPKGVERTPSRSNPVMGRPGGRKARKVQSGQGPGQPARGLGGLGLLGAVARARGKEDSSVTLGKYMKAKIDSTNESIKGGGMKADRVTEGSNYRNKRGFRKDVEAGKYTQTKDAAYYKSIGLTGKRGDRAVDDFFKPYKERSDYRKLKSGGPVKGYSKGSKKPIGYMSGGMMKPMGYKHGTSVTAKCKLGRNKPTKIT